MYSSGVYLIVNFFYIGLSCATHKNLRSCLFFIALRYDPHYSCFFFCRFDFSETRLEHLFGALAWPINGCQGSQGTYSEERRFLLIITAVFMNDNLWLKRGYLTLTEGDSFFGVQDLDQLKS